MYQFFIKNSVLAASLKLRKNVIGSVQPNIIFNNNYK